MMTPCLVKAMGEVVTMCDQLEPFLFSESKDEIAGETIRIPLNSLVQGFCRHVIQCSEVGIDNNLVVANREDHGFKRLELLHDTVLPIQRTARCFRPAISQWIRSRSLFGMAVPRRRRCNWRKYAYSLHTDASSLKRLTSS